MTAVCPICNEFVFTPEKTDTTAHGFRLTAKRGCIWGDNYEAYHEDCYINKFGPLKKPEDLVDESKYCPTCGQLIDEEEEEGEEEEDYD